MRYLIFILPIFLFFLVGCAEPPSADTDAIYPASEFFDGGETIIAVPIPDIYDRDIIDMITIRGAIGRAFGIDGYYVIMSDKEYLAYDLDELVEFLKTDDTKYNCYIEHFFDCDDFVDVLLGKVKDVMIGIPFGILWYSGDGWGHVVNIFYDVVDEKIVLIEPRTGYIYEFQQDEWQAIWVKI